MKNLFIGTNTGKRNYVNLLMVEPFLGCVEKLHLTRLLEAFDDFF